MASLTAPLIACFGGMLILVWIVPALANRRGKAPEDFPPRKGGWHAPRSA